MWLASWRRLALALVVVSVPAIALPACGGGKAKFNDAGPIDAGHDGGGVDLDAGVDAPVAHAATGTVSGAVKAASPGYSLYGTLRSGDGSSSSPQYQRRGGVTGATQP
ncbi:MAG TPA: hypothetical protein VHE35_30120 [Kofleriaceae bacterium]|nr:hypothetical protein [Kofleriaceae bacterium]